MAKKATAEEVIEVATQVKAPIKQEVAKQPTKPSWEIKDRTYILNNNREPVSYTLAAKHTRKYPLLYFDPKTNKQREIRYATNMSSPFADEQNGEATLGHIQFLNGSLTVNKENQALQKLLSIYHPKLGKTYREFKPQAIAVDQFDNLVDELEAMTIARDLDIDHAEAILRVELGSKVSKMSSKEIKRDIMIFAKTNPHLFVSLANDSNVELRNIAIKASEANIIKLSQDQRTFTWVSNGRKLMTVPFDENPYSAFAAYLKTDEGVEVFKSIDKKLN
tara:strand:- start:3873 stop:4703 length:831 start_codon:yes stop_codon:yes gene_type:complete